MDNRKKKIIYDILTEEAAKAYLKKKFKKALVMYNDALDLANELNTDKTIISTIKYMICSCLLHSCKLDDLLEAVTILQKIENCIRVTFPAICYLLAKAHCKLYRFDQALLILNEGETILNTNVSFNSLYIPGTNIQIQQNKNNDDWIKIKNECLAFRVPDAICKSIECRNIIEPFASSNKNIYRSDPTYNGMITVCCNKKQQPCIFNYHPCCWKFIKNELHKKENKDIIGNKCFKPDCKNENTPCVISHIEVEDKHGQTVVLDIKNMPSFNCFNNMNSTKDEVAKQVNQIQINQQIVVVEEKLNIDSFDESSESNKEKRFLLLFFFNYIQKNIVEINDVYTKFAEINQDLLLTDIDIVEFLLETKKFKTIDNNMSSSSSSDIDKTMTNNENNSFTEICSSSSIEDINDVYNELVNSQKVIKTESESSEDATNNIQRCQYTLLNKHNKSLEKTFNLNDKTNKSITYVESEESDCNDQISINTTLNKTLMTSSNFLSDKTKLLEITKNSMDVFGAMANENTRLENYVIELQNKIHAIEKEKSILKQGLRDKDYIIESLKKKKTDRIKEMELYESLCKTVVDSQVRYENIKDIHFKMKKEINTLMEENKELEQKLSSDNFKRITILNNFKEEFQILEVCISSEWKQKISHLEKALQAEIKTKQNLLNSYLNQQYSSNQCILYSYLDQATTLLKVIDSINSWMENTINVKLFENSEWSKRFIYLQDILNDQKIQYSKLVKLLDSDSEKLKITNLKINFPMIPNTLGPHLQEVVQKSLTTWSVIYQNFMILIYESGIPWTKITFTHNICKMLKMCLSNSKHLNLDSILHNIELPTELNVTPIIGSEEGLQQTYQQLSSPDLV